MTSGNGSRRAMWASLTHDSLNKAKAGPGHLNATEFVAANAGLLLGNVLVLFNTGAFASISLHATGELSVSPSHAAWIQTYYFISLAVALPVSTWLAARHGEVRCYVAAMLAMALGSLICSLTHELGWFLLGRILQGFFGGLTIPVSQTLLMRQYPESRRPFAVALWSVAALSPFTLGPAAGGWIADHLGWHWLFYLNVPMALFTTAVAWALLFDRPGERRDLPFDTVGFVLLSVALACLQTVINQGQDADWFNSRFIGMTAFLGILALAYFVVWELSARSPLLDLRLFARRNFAVGAVVLAVSFMLVYGLLSVLLIRLQAVAGYTSFLAGTVLLPMVFLAKPMAGFFYRIVHRFDARLLASVNMLAFAAYCHWTSTYDFFGRGSLFSEPLGSQILEGFCLGGLFVPLTTLFLSGLTPRRQTQAVELGGLLRVLGGSLGSPLLSVLWDRRAAFHQARLIETVTPYAQPARETIGQMQAAGFHELPAMATLARWAGNHAAILGLDDTFRLCAWLFLGLAAVVWLAHPARPKPKITRKEAVRTAALEELMEEP